MMKNRCLINCLVGLALTVSSSAFAESAYQVERSGGVDATGANTDGNLSGYNSVQFNQLGNLVAPTVDLSAIENRITNIEGNVTSNVTTMQNLASRVAANEQAAATAQSAATSAMSRGNQAYSRADAAYNLASAAYTKAGSAQSTASSAMSVAQSAGGTPTWTQQTTYATIQGKCNTDVQGTHKIIRNGVVVMTIKGGVYKTGFQECFGGH